MGISSWGCSKQPQEEIPMFIFCNQLFNCTQLLAIDNRCNRELMHRDLYINTPHSDIQTPLKSVQKPDDGHYRPKHVVSYQNKISFSNQLCCLTTFSSLSLVTHTTGMTHLKDIYLSLRNTNDLEILCYKIVA